MESQDELLVQDAESQMQMLQRYKRASDDNPGRSTRKNGAVRRVMKRSHICHVHCAVW